MSTMPCAMETASCEPAFGDWTVAVPHEAVIELVELLGFMALLCSRQAPALDAAILVSGLSGTYDAAALAAHSVASAWLLGNLACPDPEAGP